MALAPKGIEPGIINSMLMRFRINNSVNSKFIYHLFESKLGQMLRDRSYGGAVSQIPSSKEIKKIKIPLPPIEIQNNIIVQIEKEQKNIKEYEKMIEISEQQTRDTLNELWEE